MKRLLGPLPLAGLGIALLVSGCGSGDPAAESDAPGSGNANVEVAEAPAAPAGRADTAPPEPLDNPPIQQNETSERSIAVEFTGTKSVEVYQPMQLSVDKADSRSEIRFLNLPEGMVYDKEQLTWTPASHQVGTHTLRARVKNGELRHEYDVQVEVVRKPVAVPFDVQRLRLSSEGSLALVWGRKENRRRGFNRRSDNPINQLAVVDVAKREVLVATESARPMTNAWLTSEHVYLVLDNTEVGYPVEIQQLNTSDLKLVKSIMTKEAPEQSEVQGELLGDKLLIVENEEFKLPELTPTEPANRELEERFNPRRTGNRAEGKIDGLIWRDGVYWDQDYASARLLSNPSRFFRVGRNPPNSNNKRHSRNLWGGRMKDRDLVDAEGKEILRGRSYPFRLTPLTNLSAVCQLRREVEVETEDRQKQAGITIHRLDDGELTQKLVLANLPRDANDNWIGFSCAGSTIAACLDGDLYLVSESEIDPEPLPKLFRIGIGQTLSIKPQGATKVSYDVLDGTPPYQLELTLSNQKYSATGTTVTVRADELTKDISVATSRMLTQYVGGGDPRERVLEYVEYVTPLFRKLTGRDPTGMPVVIPARLSVTDAKLQSDTLDHAFLMELPLRDIGMQVENLVAGSRERSLNQRNRSRSQSVARERSSSRRRTQARADLDKEISQSAAKDYRQRLLRKYPSDQVPTEQLDELATEALKEMNSLFEQVLAKKKGTLRGGIRRWTSANGHSTRAMLQSVFAEQVVLRSPEGKEITVPLEKLSEDDQEYVEQYLNATTDNRPSEYVPTQLQAQLAAISKHKSKKYRYPPAFLTNESGSASLSWRVLILPYIGGEKLFELFRFDEPWDSPHNQRLVRFIPAMYKSLDPQVDGGKTTILALQGSNALLSNDIPRASSDKVDSLSSIPLLAEVKSEHALEWTRPEDLTEASVADISSWLQSRDDLTYVGMANGKVKQLSAFLSVGQWQQGIDCVDGEEPDYSVSKTDTGLASSTQRPEKSIPKQTRKRTAKRQRKIKLVRIAPKQFAILNAQPDQSLVGQPKKLDGGFEVRSAPFHFDHFNHQVTCAVSPQGIVYGFKQGTLFEFDPSTGQVEKQCTLKNGATSIHWSDGTLVLTRRIEAAEQRLFSGEWKRVEGQVDRALPIRHVSFLEAWIVDPKTFKVKRGFELPGDWLSCATESSKALLMSGNSSIERIGLVDLRRGELLSMLPAPGESEGKNQSELPDNLSDVDILPDGESGIAIDSQRLYRLDFTAGQLSFGESSRTMHLSNDPQTKGFELSTDGQFVGVSVSNSKDKRLRGESGYLFYSTANLKQAYGVLQLSSDSYRGPGVLAMNSDSKTVIASDEDIQGLIVFQNGKTRRMSQLPGDRGARLRPERLLAIPNSESALLLGSYQGLLVSVQGQSEKWAFAPASDEAALGASALAATTPKEPLRFVESETNSGEMILDSDPSYDFAAFSPDGRYLYLQEFYEGIISCFDTNSYRELRRYRYESSSDSPLGITKLGVLLFLPDEEEFHVLDFKTLDGKLSFRLEEIIAFATAPQSSSVVSITQHGDLRVHEIASGKMLTELPLEEQMKWEPEDDRRSRNQPMRSLTMSDDGKSVLMSLQQNHVLRLSGKKFKYICRAPELQFTGSHEIPTHFFSAMAAMSPSGEFLASGAIPRKSFRSKSKVFQLPKVANAASIVEVEHPVAVDDEGRIYGTTGDVDDRINASYANHNIAVYDLQGKQIYREPENIRDNRRISTLLLQPGRPGFVLIHSGSDWHFVDTNKQHKL